MNRLFTSLIFGELTLILCALLPSSGNAQSKLIVAIQPTVASDEMLKKAKPLQQFLEQGLGGRTEVELYVPALRNYKLFDS